MFRTSSLPSASNRPRPTGGNYTGGYQKRQPDAKKPTLAEERALEGHLQHFENVKDVTIVPNSAKDRQISFIWDDRTFFGTLPDFEEAHVYQILSFDAKPGFRGTLEISAPTVKVTHKPLTVKMLAILCEHTHLGARYCEYDEMMTALKELRASSPPERLFADVSQLRREVEIQPHHELKTEGLMGHYLFQPLLLTHPYFGSAGVVKVTNLWLKDEFRYAHRRDLGFLRRALLGETWRCFFHGTIPAYIQPLIDVDIPLVEMYLKRTLSEVERSAIKTYHHIVDFRDRNNMVAIPVDRALGLFGDSEQHIVQRDLQWMCTKKIFERVDLPSTTNLCMESCLLDTRLFRAEEKVANALKPLLNKPFDDDIAHLLSKIILEQARELGFSLEQAIALVKLLQTRLHFLNGGPGTGKTHLGAIVFAHMMAYFRGWLGCVSTGTAIMKNSHTKKYLDALPGLDHMMQVLCAHQPGYPTLRQREREKASTARRHQSMKPALPGEAITLAKGFATQQARAQQVRDDARLQVMGFEETAEEFDVLELPPASDAEDEFIDQWRRALAQSDLFAPPHHELNSLDSPSIRQWVLAWGSPLTSVSLVKELSRKLKTPLEDLISRLENTGSGIGDMYHEGAQAQILSKRAHDHVVTEGQVIDDWLEEELFRHMGVRLPVNLEQKRKAAIDAGDTSPQHYPIVEYHNFAEIIFQARMTGSARGYRFLIIDEQMLNMVQLANLLDAVGDSLEACYFLGDMNQLGPREGGSFFQTVVHGHATVPIFNPQPSLEDLFSSTVCSRLVTNWRIAPSEKNVKAADLICGKKNTGVGGGEKVKLRPLAQAIEDIARGQLPANSREFSIILPAEMAPDPKQAAFDPLGASMSAATRVDSMSTERRHELLLQTAFRMYEMNNDRKFITSYVEERDLFNLFFYRHIRPDIYQTIAQRKRYAPDEKPYKILRDLPFYVGQTIRICTNTNSCHMQTSNGEVGRITWIFTRGRLNPKGVKNADGRKQENGLACFMNSLQEVEYLQWKEALIILDNMMILEMKGYSQGSLTTGFANTLHSWQGSQGPHITAISLKTVNLINNFTDRAVVYTSASRAMESFSFIASSRDVVKKMIDAVPKPAVSQRMLQMLNMQEKHRSGRLPIFDWLLNRIGRGAEDADKYFNDILNGGSVSLAPAPMRQPTLAEAVANIPVHPNEDDDGDQLPPMAPIVVAAPVAAKKTVVVKPIVPSAAVPKPAAVPVAEVAAPPVNNTAEQRPKISRPAPLVPMAAANPNKRINLGLGKSIAVRKSETDANELRDQIGPPAMSENE